MGDPQEARPSSVPSLTSPQEGKLHAILAMCKQMNAERDLPALFDLVAREATQLLEADRASIFLLDDAKQQLWSQVALESEPIRFDARLGIAGAAALTGETINVSNAQNDPRFYSGVDDRGRYRTRTILCVPLQTATGNILGAFEVLNKKGGPFTEADEHVLRTLASQAAVAIETAQVLGEIRRQRDTLLEENTQLRREVEERFATQNIIGTSEPIQRIIRIIEQIRDSPVNVLITGESGTGKELVAKALHYSSPRARHSFVALNCAALPDNLVESELFGIEKGIATGVEQRSGRFEDANGGTLFLDEIGDLSLTAQAKILRVLQENMVERIGRKRPIPINVRLIAATNKDLDAEMAEGHFREDLYYRLKVVHLQTPSLRDIAEDIPLLANHFLTAACQEFQKPEKTLSPATLRCLSAYHWPGNVRQLENEMRQAVALARRKAIGPDDLSEAVRGQTAQPVVEVNPEASRSLKDIVSDVEKQYIIEALQAHRNNQQQTAKTLGISRQGLIKKMKRYGITTS